uniref:PorP/SprF family type IX secretion system membrane protein n=1 Tax=Flavobacterium sp. TaxID=239 RepID=UPI0040472DE7
MEMRKLIKSLVVIHLLLLISTEKLFSQQDPQFTNYMYNTIVINPAYAGTRDVLSFLALYRAQWVGLDGAPITASASVHSPVSNSNVAWGISVINDEIGPATEQNISADFAYRITFSNLSKLSFGIKATANLLNVDYTKLSIYDPTDPVLQNNVDNRFTPNIGAGLYWYSDQFYLGVSIPSFLETKYYDDNTRSSVANSSMDYYFMGGYVFNLSDSIQFKPAFLTKIMSGNTLQSDVTANFLFFEKLTLGSAYRINGAISALVGFQFSNSVFVGYSYDTEATNLANYNSGSHEIFLRFELFKSGAKIYSPRFF